LLGGFIIETGDKLYVCVRQLKDQYINKVEGWEDLLKTFYNVDRIFRKNDNLFLVRDIDDVTEL
tara:strand:+ start:9585 stop:9776 length:192 start_codon:yes stop_codon:yes gene_type:complete